MSDKLNQFVGQRYISLETYRRNGGAVRTPLWFVEHSGELMFYTMAASGKAKRLQRDPRVRVAPCDARGTVKGGWVEGTTRSLEGEEARQVQAMLNRKYGWQRGLIKPAGTATPSAACRLRYSIHLVATEGIQ